MHISKKAAPPPYLPTIMLLHTLEVLTPVSYCIMKQTKHIFAYQKIFIHLSIIILGILKTGKKCVKMHKRSLLHSFERPRRNIDSFVLDVLKTGTSAKDSGAAYNLFYCLFCLQQIWNSFSFYFGAFLWRQRIYDFLLNLASKLFFFYCYESLIYRVLLFQKELDFLRDDNKSRSDLTPYFELANPPISSVLSPILRRLWGFFKRGGERSPRTIKKWQKQNCDAFCRLNVQEVQVVQFGQRPVSLNFKLRRKRISLSCTSAYS